MALSDRFLAVHRDSRSGEVLASGGDPEAHSVLQRCGFVPVVRVHDSYHRAPIGLTAEEETRLASGAVGRLRALGYHVDCDEAFDTDLRPPHYLPLGARITSLVHRLQEATTTTDAAEVLTELTATHDGILAGLEAVLTATADFYDGLGEPIDVHTARRLRSLTAEPLRIIRNDLTHVRNSLHDRHAPHPARSTCTGQVPTAERERSAVCACAPPPGPVPVSPPSAGPRR
ncbi:hypothetical protein J7I94_02025 [Streptomyces sp. ISL-12]|uniref:hypothetical protein n=1 Tax=Streptomyces sp. ISL-12 TaxID=2819177 RepID=UPI001BEBC050|nr:hypothetical protein [Streptomyces sp. ISL-12]MBT2409349.1 hypothetical protein [Streptomyces sp. ISL-12]